MSEKVLLQCFGAGGAALYGYITGINFTLLYIYLLIVFADIALGALVAYIQEKFSAKRLRTSCLKKVVIITVLFVFMLLEFATQEMGMNFPVANTLIGIFAVADGISVIKTGSKVVKLPAGAVSWLAKIDAAVNTDYTKGDENSDEN